MNEQFNFDPKEKEKFSQLSAQWWDKQGPMKPLHIINAPRLSFIEFFPQTANSVLDIGCGGGILAEEINRIGHHTTGIDVSPELIKVAQMHADNSNLNIDYRCTTVESFAEHAPKSFNIITCMELLEHVPDPASIVQACHKLLDKNGKLYLSTLNRNIYAYLGAVLGAEYLMKILPKGTHQYEKFVKPSELAQWLRESGFYLSRISGIHYNPVIHQASLSPSTKINYIVECKKNH